MNFWNTTFLIVGLGLSAAFSAAANEVASQQLFQADLLTRRGDQFLEEGKPQEAGLEYRQALTLFRQLHKDFPRYQNATVARRIGGLQQKLKGLEQSGSRAREFSSSEVAVFSSVTPPAEEIRRAQSVKPPDRGTAVGSSASVEAKELSSIRQTLAETEEALAVSREKNDDLQKRLQQAESELAVAISDDHEEVDIDKLREEARHYREKLNEVRDEQAAESKAFTLMQQQLEKKTAELEEAESRLSELELSSDEETEKQLAELKAAREELRSLREALGVEDETLASAGLDRLLSERKDLVAENKELKKQISELRREEHGGARSYSSSEDSTALAEVEKRLEVQAAEHETSLQQIEKLQEELAAANQEVSNLQERLHEEESGEPGNLSEKDEQLLRQRLEEYQRRMELAGQDRMKTIEKVGKLQLQLAQTQDALEEAEERADSLTQKGADLEEGRQLLIAAGEGEEGQNSLGSRIETLNNALRRTQSEIKLLKQENAALKSASTSSRQESDAKMKEEAENLVSQLEAARKENAKLQEEAQRLLRSRFQVEARLQTVEGKLESEQQALDKAKERALTAENERQQLVAKLEKANERMAEMEEEQQNLQEQMDERMAQLQDPIEEDADGQSDPERVAKLTRQNENLKRELERLRGELERKDAQIALANAERQPPVTESTASQQQTEPPQESHSPEKTESATSVAMADPLMMGPGAVTVINVEDPFELDLESPPAPANQGAPLGGPIVGTSSPAPAGLDSGQVDLAREASRHFQRQEFEQAEKLFQQMLEKDPNNVFALSNLGVVYFKTNRNTKAEEVLTRAIEVDSQDAFSYETLGIVYFKEGKIDEAIEVLSKSLAIEDKSATAHNFLGIAAAVKGWPEAAEDELRKAITLNPKYADAHFNLAVLYSRRDPPSLALAAKHYNKALSLGSRRSDDLDKVLSEKGLLDN